MVVSLILTPISQRVANDCLELRCRLTESKKSEIKRFPELPGLGRQSSGTALDHNGFQSDLGWQEAFGRLGTVGVGQNLCEMETYVGTYHDCSKSSMLKNNF